MIGRHLTVRTVRYSRGVSLLGHLVLGWVLLLPETGLGQLRSSEPISPAALELLQTHCSGCHGAAEPEAGLNLEHFRTVGSIRLEPEIWEKVLRRVVSGSMPPPASNSMSGEERDQLGRWIDSALHAIDCSESAQPGHVTLRRLNRNEYRHSILDLLQVDYRTAATFPGDDAGYGFDNIGDVLSLPPVLLEKYLTAAEEISRLTIRAPEDIPPLETVLPLDRWSMSGGQNRSGGQLRFTTTGEAVFQHHCETPFSGVLRIQVLGIQAGDEACRMSVHVDRRKLGTYTISGRDQLETVEIPLRMAKGLRRLRISFDNDYYNPEAADAADRDRNLEVSGVMLVSKDPSAGEVPPGHRSFFFVMPGKELDERAAAKKLLSVWASRFFRRPANPAEVTRLMEVFDSAREDEASFEQAMQYGLQAILCSPRFLFKVEQPPPPDGTARSLAGFELATSLSYFLWNSTPDAGLLESALHADLQDPAILRVEVDRMLQHPHLDRMIDSFVSQWLQLRAIELAQPDPELFAGADRSLIEDMRRETVLFCQDLFRSERSLLELLSADYSFVNARLADHYGLPDTAGLGSGFVRVDLAGTARRGLLTQASILTVTSNPNRTSPVKRGRWILENMLGEPPPPALPDVMALEQQELTGTLRQRMEQHRRDPACASCHDVMDPLGFALENFDAVGRWRSAEAGLEIDASGKLPSGEEFDGAVELLEVLREKKQQQFLRCLTEKMMIYALGRGLRYQDQCAVNEILLRLEKNQFRFSELIHGIVESVPFRQRQARTGE